MKFELISFNLCPFVQRSLITLLHKSIPHTITYIDLSNRPQWFVELSPLGKVPLLKVDDDHLLFESAVINEFIDEVTSDPLMPSEPLVRAQNRAWIEFGGSLLEHQYRMVSLASTEEDCLVHRDKLFNGLKRVSEQLGSGPYFNGGELSLVDTAYAPLFLHIETANTLEPLFSFESLPKIQAWKEALLELPAVRQSVIEDFASVYQQELASEGSYYSRFARAA